MVATPSSQRSPMTAARDACDAPSLGGPAHVDTPWMPICSAASAANHQPVNRRTPSPTFVERIQPFIIPSYTMYAIERCPMLRQRCGAEAAIGRNHQSHPSSGTGTSRCSDSDESRNHLALTFGWIEAFLVFEIAE